MFRLGERSGIRRRLGILAELLGLIEQLTALSNAKGLIGREAPRFAGLVGPLSSFGTDPSGRFEMPRLSYGTHGMVILA